MLQGEDVFMPATLTDAKIMLFCKKTMKKKEFLRPQRPQIPLIIVNNRRKGGAVCGEVKIKTYFCNAFS